MPLPRAYLVDDERPALERLARLLEQSGRLEVVGRSVDPLEALQSIPALSPDVLFLDIEMPEMNGFELALRLPSQPMIVFATAYNQYALKAFELNSIDYLLKPVTQEQLARALAKIEQRAPARAPSAIDLQAVLEELRAAPLGGSLYPERVASRIGGSVELVPLSAVTHFAAKDKLSYAVTLERRFVVDETLAQLERRLDPRRFFRAHRATLVHLEYVDAILGWAASGARLRLKDGKATELPIARDRVSALKAALGL